jgi:hypothetical protein
MTRSHKCLSISRSARRSGASSRIRIGRTWARRAIFELETGEEFPGGTLDSDITDAIVQIAAFGELVYG